MAGERVRRLIVAACAAGTLAGCVQGLGGGATPAPSAAPASGKPATSVKLVDRDVEAPEIFQTTDTALWDGRPSLGGVWVAAPDAIDPERVILRNPANGKFIIGALFRRERENPGPRLQISSDAATALGVLAGQPVKIQVTALRREEAAAKTDATKPILDAAETLPGAAVAQDTAAVLAKPAASAPAPIAPPGASIKAGTIKAGSVSAAPIKPGVATPAPAAAKPAAPPAPAKAAATPAKPAASGTHLVQIGIFSVEANAKRATDALSKAGVAATLRKGQTQGKDHWSVTASGADKAALLAKVKSLGFTDAYIIK